ncbi:hypothetical protein D3C72_1237450 [compost metagenome]
MDIISAWRLGEPERKTVRDIGKAFHRQRTAGQIIQSKIDHIQGGKDFVDTHFQTRDNVAALLAVYGHRQQTVTDKRVIGAGIAGVTAGAHHWADVAEVAGDLRIETAHTDGTLLDIWRAQKHIHQILHIAAHLLCQQAGLDHVVFQQIAANPAYQVQTVSFTRPSEDFRHLHRRFTHAEELHKPGIKADEVTGEAEVQQV